VAPFLVHAVGLDVVTQPGTSYHMLEWHAMTLHSIIKRVYTS